MATKGRKKRNFADTDIDVLVSEVENRKTILFGSHSSGVTNKRKSVEWQQIVEAVNNVSGTERTMPEIKKKWSDLKVEAKKCLSSHRLSLAATGGGKGEPNLTSFEKRMAFVLGQTSVCGIVPENESDTDFAETKIEPGKAQFHLFIICINELKALMVVFVSSGPPEPAGCEMGPSEESPGEQEVGDEGPAVPCTTAPRMRGAFDRC